MRKASHRLTLLRCFQTSYFAPTIMADTLKDLVDLPQTFVREGSQVRVERLLCGSALADTVNV